MKRGNQRLLERVLTSASEHRPIEFSNTSGQRVGVINLTLQAWAVTNVNETNNEQQAELERFECLVAVPKRNGNELFLRNIEWEIAFVQRGELSPLIEEYLTKEERASREVENQTMLR